MSASSSSRRPVWHSVAQWDGVPFLASRLSALWILVGCAALWAAVGATVHPAGAQHYLPDDPIWEDPDRLDMPIPEKRGYAEAFDPIDFIIRTFGQPGSFEGPAANVNTLGEVPNSSWYTNRHYHDPMTLDALRRGPNRSGPPSLRAPWRVVDVASLQGAPRAVVIDADGRRFGIIFDPKAHPEMVTGAAMTSSRLLYALGYNVPEHYLLHITPNRLTPAPDTNVTRGAVWGLFNDAPASSDGTYRVVATHIPDVVARIGAFRFHGTRSDDGNDIFPHEGRRELRGLRVVAAWINHSKVRSNTTLDAVVRVGDRRFVRHYLTDLGLTLGSAGGTPKPPWSGHEHILELSPVLTRIGTLGLSGGDWVDAATPRMRGVGHLQAKYFRPEAWKPEYPNPAFERCDPVDAFWAARQVAHVTREQLAAMVDVAAFTDTASTRYLVETLVARRDSIARAYLHVAGGIDRFEVRGDTLSFVDLRVEHGLLPGAPARDVAWHVYDNDAATTQARLRHVTTTRTSVALPDRRPPFLRAVIRTAVHGTTTVTLRRTGGDGGAAYEVVGIDRVP